MKWITTDYKGNKKIWYSEDVIEKIKEICKSYDYYANSKVAIILELLNEVDK